MKHPYVESFLHKCHWITHCVYLGLVFVESHGYYGVAAGAMLIVVIVIKVLDFIETGG